MLGSRWPHTKGHSVIPAPPPAPPALSRNVLRPVFGPPVPTHPPPGLCLKGRGGHQGSSRAVAERSQGMRKRLWGERAVSGGWKCGWGWCWGMGMPLGWSQGSGEGGGGYPPPPSSDSLPPPPKSPLSSCVSTRTSRDCQPCPSLRDPPHPSSRSPAVPPLPRSPFCPSAVLPIALPVPQRRGP